MHVSYAKSILRSQSGRGCQGIAAVSGDDFLIGFQAAVSKTGQYYVALLSLLRGKTYAPPELSEPAMTRTRGGVIVIGIGLRDMRGV